MNTLKVTFDYFFILVADLNAPSIILPEGTAHGFPHRVIMEHDGGSYAIQQGLTWGFVSGTSPASLSPFHGGGQCQFNLAGVLDLNGVAPGATVKASRSAPPANAVITMPTGRFQSGGTVDPQHTNTLWTVGTSAPQKISDRLLFECDIEATHSYAITIGNGSLPLTADTNGDISVVVRCLDMLPSPTAPFKGVLSEYLAIYDFLDTSGTNFPPHQQLPLPVAHRPGFRFGGPSRPICGGAWI
jgi:hypothetical protein